MPSISHILQTRSLKPRDTAPLLENRQFHTLQHSKANMVKTS